MIEAGPLKQKVFSVRTNPPRFAPEGDSSSSRGSVKGYVPDEEVPGFYNLADALVFPSLYEGFGIPVLEAMACGCLVVASTEGASLEVAGGAALIALAWFLPRVDVSLAGRAYAAYGGVYIASSLAWLWAGEGHRPDRWDALGAVVALAGAAIILRGPRSSG